MPGLRIDQIERIAEAALEELYPAALRSPQPVDLCHLIDTELPRHGIHISPASFLELGNREAVTDPAGDDEIEILLLEDRYEDLFAGGSKANRARATVGHELGHGVLHVPVIRRWRKLPTANLLLARTARANMQPWEDPEWQAWCFAGAFLVPARTLRPIRGEDLWTLAQFYNVSPDFMRSRLKRLKG